MNDYNASDRRAIRRAARLAKQAEAERRGVVLSLMSSPAGRNYVYERLTRCHVFSSSYSSDGFAMAFNEGERNIGLQDLNDIMQFAPDQYIQMTREASDRNQANEHRTDNSGYERSGADSGGGDSRRPDDAVGSVDHDYDPGEFDGDDAGREDPSH